MTLQFAAHPDPDLASLKRTGWFALAIIVTLGGGFATWASLSPISGAVTAPGSIMLEGYAKRVQHQEGGIVTAIHVHDGDSVEAGQVLAELDQTTIGAALAVLDKQVMEGLLREARLIAEVNLAGDLELPDGAEEFAGRPEFDIALQTERQALTVRQAAISSRQSQLAEQVTQLHRQIEGLQVQLDAVETQLGILEGEITNYKALYAGQLVEATRLTTLEKQQAEAQGQRGNLISLIAEANAQIAERQLQISQVEQDFTSAALDELQETRRTLFDAMQERIAQADRLARTEIRAPQAGVVHQSILHTVGGVVAAGETLMLVVPQDDDLVITTRVNPTDIEKVFIGQEAHVRLAGFSQRTTPELAAKVTMVAPDLTQDQVTGQYFYNARITILQDELDRLPDDIRLVPGMPVEAFIKTADRTVLSYLLQPFVEQLDYAFREE